MKSQIFKNLFSNYLGNFVSMLLGFLIVPFLVSYLGKGAFGISILAESLIVLFQIFSFSIRLALAHHATVSLSQKKVAEFYEYLSAGRKILNIAAFIVFIPGAILSAFFPQIFNVPEQLDAQSRILFFLIVLSFTISMPNMVCWSVLYASHRFDLINYANFGGAIVRAIAIFIIFKFVPLSGYGLTIYGLIYLATTFSQNLIIYLWHKKLLPADNIGSSAGNNAKKIKELLSFGGYASISAIAYIMYETTMNIAINLVMGPSLNAIYAIGTKIPAIFRRLFLEPASSLAPTFSALVANNDKVRLKRLFLFYSKVINIFVFPMGYVLMIFSTLIIQKWMGPDFQSSADVMPLFMGAIIASMPLAICSGINNAYGKIKLPALISLVSSTLNVILGLTLGFGLGMGIKGVALSALLINFVTYTIFMPAYACRYIEVSKLAYWMQTIIKPLLLTLSTFGLLSLLVLNYQKNINFYLLDFEYLMVSVVYAIGAYKIVFNVDEKLALQDLLFSVLRKFGVVPRMAS
ncbi:oligosaccharide flippase family protein [Actimicrobium antarcticum]|uniref:Polysaccharide biosynthesis protein C-terminal domain-containing protein n=1 Tax=Actimicrobium antarcticum TaxID=1051899 RepID=A0ABP7T4G2_9BURK